MGHSSAARSQSPVSVLTLREVGQARGDVYAIADDLEFVNFQLVIADPGVCQPHASAGDSERLGCLGRFPLLLIR